MKRRWYAILIFALVAIFLLSSCNNNVSVMSLENHTSSKWNMSYNYLNGSKSISEKIDLKEGQEGIFKVDVVSDEGEINLSIEDEEGKSYYSGTKIPTSSFTVTVDKSSDYKLHVDAKEHKGSFHISWVVEAAKK